MALQQEWAGYRTAGRNESKLGTTDLMLHPAHLPARAVYASLSYSSNFQRVSLGQRQTLLRGSFDGHYRLRSSDGAAHRCPVISSGTVGPVAVLCFPDSPHGAGLAGEGALATAAGGFATQAAGLGTPKTTVDGWNSDGEVTWLVVSNKLMCRARLGAGGVVDCIACCRGTAGYTTSSHKQNDVNVKRVLFPEFDGEALVIEVQKSSQTVKTWIFS